MNKKIYLKNQKEIHCYEDDKKYLLKETTGGRFFVWIPKYSNNADEVKVGHGLNYKDFDCDKNWHEAWDKSRESVDKNKEKGHCIELGRWSYEDFLIREKDSKKTLESNKKWIEPDGSNPHNIQIYKGAPEDNARVAYERKENKLPYGWGPLMGRWGSQSTWYIPDMFKKSDRFYDNKKEIKYDREFFNLIKQNISTVNRALKELKSLIKENCKTMELYEEFENHTSAVEIKKITNRLKLEFYFNKKMKEMEVDIKKMLPRDRSLLDSSINYEIKFNGETRKIYNSAYSMIK